MERPITACEQANLPAPARKALRLPADRLVDTQRRIDDLTADIRADARAHDDAQRLQRGAGPENDPGDRFPGDCPGIGPITASARLAALPDIAAVRSERDRAARLGLTPKPHATGGKARLGRSSGMGNRYLRRRLHPGAIAQAGARRRGEAGDDRLWQILRRKKPKQAAIAPADRMAQGPGADAGGAEYRAAQPA